jgi:hypothetical protein
MSNGRICPKRRRAQRQSTSENRGRISSAQTLDGMPYPRPRLLTDWRGHIFQEGLSMLKVRSGGGICVVKSVGC